MTNVQFHSNEQTLKRFAGKMDWVILDVPCSGSFCYNIGTGTIRRNPDLKWKFSEQNLKNLVKTQRGSYI